jgi:conjugal transfer pilus assembly protein TraK
MAWALPVLAQTAPTTATQAIANDPRVLTVTPNQTVNGVVSLREISRIAIKGGHIRFADYRSDAADIFQDKVKGEVQVLPFPQDPRPINLIVTSAQGATYTLVLEVRDLPSQTILLNDPSAKPSRNGATGARSLQSPEYTKNLRAMTLAMFKGLSSVDIDMREVDRPVQLWQGTDFRLSKRYESTNMIGLHFVLTNTGIKPMRLAEQEFFKPGVLSVSLPKQDLNAHESADVYVVMERSDEQ